MRKQLVILSLVLAATTSAFALGPEATETTPGETTAAAWPSALLGKVSDFLQTSPGEGIARGLGLPTNRSITSTDMAKLGPSKIDALVALSRLNLEKGAITIRVNAAPKNEQPQINQFVEKLKSMLANSLTESGSKSWTVAQRRELDTLSNLVLDQPGVLTIKSINDSIAGLKNLTGNQKVSFTNILGCQI